MSEKKRFRVRVGNRFVTVGRHAKGWRFGWKDGGRWRYVTRRKRAEIVEEAERVLEEEGRGLVWSRLRAAERERLGWLHGELRRDEDWEALRAWVAARKGSEGLAEAVGRFLAWKEEEAGRRTRHLGQVRALLERLAEDFPKRAVADLGAPEVESWWRDRCEGLSAKRRRDVRGVLVTFWKWARREGLVVDSVTPPERLPCPKVGHGEKRVLTPGELVAVLNAVRPQFRAWVVLGAFAGMRPEEIAPQRSTGRRGLYCEEIDWRFGVLRIPAEVAGKIRRPRVVPMCDALRRGLEWAGIGPGMTGPVVIGDPSTGHDSETLRLGALVFGGKWPQDALRHSYGSYRNAQVRALGQVAEEMGTSETMLHRHYHNPRAPEEADAWFSVVLMRSDSGGVWREQDHHEMTPNDHGNQQSA